MAGRPSRAGSAAGSLWFLGDSPSTRVHLLDFVLRPQRFVTLRPCPRGAPGQGVPWGGCVWPCPAVPSLFPELGAFPAARPAQVLGVGARHLGVGAHHLRSLTTQLIPSLQPGCCSKSRSWGLGNPGERWSRRQAAWVDKSALRSVLVTRGMGTRPLLMYYWFLGGSYPSSHHLEKFCFVLFCLSQKHKEDEELQTPIPLVVGWAANNGI